MDKEDRIRWAERIAKITAHIQETKKERDALLQELYGNLLIARMPPYSSGEIYDPRHYNGWYEVAPISSAALEFIRNEILSNYSTRIAKAEAEIKALLKED